MDPDSSASLSACLSEQDELCFGSSPIETAPAPLPRWPLSGFPRAPIQRMETKTVRVCVNRTQRWVYKRDPAREKGSMT